MRVIIAGCRTFEDYDHLKKLCDYYLTSKTEVEIVSGGAKGADALGERYAKERGYPIKHFYPDWKNFGKSKGTASMIDLAKKYNLLLRVCII